MEVFGQVFQSGVEYASLLLFGEICQRSDYPLEMTPRVLYFRSYENNSSSECMHLPCETGQCDVSSLSGQSVVIASIHSFDCLVDLLVVCGIAIRVLRFDPSRNQLRVDCADLNEYIRLDLVVVTLSLFPNSNSNPII